MAALIPLNADTAEQQAFELLHKLNASRSAFVAANPTVNIQGLSVGVNVSLSTNQVTFTVTLPIEQTQDADGGLSLDAREVMVV